MGRNKPARLHALAVRCDAIARELGATAATLGHHTGIGGEHIGHRIVGAGRSMAHILAHHSGLIHGLPVAGTQAQLALEGLQLLHEVEVGRHVRLPVPHHHEGVVETEATGMHQVGQRHGHRARHPGQAVDQHRRVRRARFLCGTTNQIIR